jgi:hypothetical protein
MSAWLGLGEVEVAPRGTLAAALGRALVARAEPAPTRPPAPDADAGPAPEVVAAPEVVDEMDVVAAPGVVAETGTWAPAEAGSTGSPT